MPLRTPLPKRPQRSRIQTSISGGVHEQVDLYCAHHGLSESAFFEAAALEKLAGTGDAKQIFRRFTEQRRLALEVRQYVQIFAELLSFHVQHSLRHLPPLPKAELQDTRRRADVTYRELIQRIGANLSSGRGFLDAFPSESLDGEDARPRNGTSDRPQPDGSRPGRARAVAPAERPGARSTGPGARGSEHTEREKQP